MISYLAAGDTFGSGGPKRPGQTGFKVLARRWIVERSLSWLMNARRNVIDFERKPSHSEAHLTVAAITLMTRRLTRKSHPPGSGSQPPRRRPPENPSHAPRRPGMPGSWSYPSGVSRYGSMTVRHSRVLRAALAAAALLASAPQAQ